MVKPLAETHSTAPDTITLSDEQRNLILRQFDIQVCVGAHGFDREPGFDLRNPFRVPNQSQYDAAARVTSQLGEGDVLFTEMLGFTDRPPSLREQSGVSYDRFGYCILGDLAMRQGSAPAMQYRWLELMRQRHEMNAWTYAALLASMNGASTHYADMSGSRLVEWNAAHKHGPFAKRALQNAREQQACNIVIEWALQHADPDENELSDDKPKIVLLFGRDHERGIQRAFEQSGLPISVTAMQDDSHDTPWRTVLPEWRWAELDYARQRIIGWLGAIARRHQ